MVLNVDDIDYHVPVMVEDIPLREIFQNHNLGHIKPPGCLQISNEAVLHLLKVVATAKKNYFAWTSLCQINYGVYSLAYFSHL